MKKHFLFGMLLAVVLSVTVVPVAQSACEIDIPPSLMLLGAGARWAAQGAGPALYVNWQDNLYLHPNPWGRIYTEPNPGDSISYILERYGFDVEFAGDIPDDLNKYSVVVITAYWAVEPAKEPIIRDYVSHGGGVVLESGVPPYFVTYCKDWWPGPGDLTPIQDWFGAGRYVNTGGYATVTIDNPFGTSLKSGDILVGTEGAPGGGSAAAVSGLQPGAEIVAKWGTGYIFSFTYETTGRVYYLASCEEIPVLHLNPGWNLISFNREPNDTTISCVLSPIDGLYSVVMGYDQGGLSYYPEIPDEYNTLKEMDPYHGYWIKTTTTTTLPIGGDKVPVTTPLFLDEGWNLVSYLPDCSQPLTTALASIEGQYEAVLGYEQGAMSAYPELPEYMNTLQTLEPQHGYWIKMKQPGTLTYFPCGGGGLVAGAAMAANAAQAPAGVTPTNQWVDFYSFNTTVNGFPIPTGSTVTAYDPDGAKIGECIVKQPGRFGVLSLYGDDPLTQEDEGAKPGDTITFYINGQKATAIGSDGPVWTTFGDLRNVDLTVTYHPVHKVYLSLILK